MRIDTGDPEQLRDLAKKTADVAKLMKAAADPTRLRLLSILGSLEPDEGYAVTDLVEEVGGLTQSTVSHHLRLLREAGFVNRTRSGSWHVYTLSGDVTGVLADYLATHIKKKPRK